MGWIFSVVNVVGLCVKYFYFLCFLNVFMDYGHEILNFVYFYY